MEAPQETPVEVPAIEAETPIVAESLKEETGSVAENKETEATTIEEAAVEPPQAPPAPAIPAAVAAAAPVSAVEAHRSTEPEPAAPQERDGIAELFGDDVERVDPNAEVPPPAEIQGSIIAPGYWQGFEGPVGRINVFAFAGFIFAFLFFPLGFIFSSVGIVNAKAVPKDMLGRILGWAGLAISGIALLGTILWIIFLPFRILVGAW